MSPDFQAQLAQVQAVSANQRAKAELQEQLQFADEMPNVIITAEEDVLQTEFVNVAYVEGPVGAFSLKDFSIYNNLYVIGKK